VDHDRYLALGRAAVAETMGRVFGEWRRATSTCRGGLVWFLRDLWEGAGWGILDAHGVPKSAYFQLRRVLAPIALHLSDEGSNGLELHVCNDTPRDLSAVLEIALYRDGEIQTGRGEKQIALPPRSVNAWNACDLLGAFFDVTWAYRFGPPVCDVIVATLRDAQGARLARAFHFPAGHSPHVRDVGLSATLVGEEITVRAERLALGVVVEAPGCVASDAWFHVPPGGEHTLRVSGIPPARGSVHALNATHAAKITVSSGS
jgi:beta-mannosidase